MIKGKRPSEEDIFYKKWGWETLKENIGIMDSVLKQFISLNIAVLSLYSGFYERIIMDPRIKISLFILFVISFVSSIWGVIPFSSIVNLNNPQEVKRYKHKKFKFKQRCIFVTALMFFLGFTIFLISNVNSQ
jgi:hypothetical protein